jgi:ribonuclease HI
MYDPNAVKIYTDGSARPTNPGNGGIGLVVEYPDNLNLENLELSEGYKLSTNNRMELTAVISAMEWLQHESIFRRFTRVIIITDSEYVSANYKNAQYWKENDWSSEEGRPYENRDLWDTFLKQRKKIRIHNEICWEKGKGRPVLLRVDALAKEGSGNPTKTDYGYKGGKFTATRTKSKKAATLYSANGQEILIRVYKTNIYGRGSKQIYKVTFDLYDEISKSYLEKYVAYYDAKECPDLKRNNCYRATFNYSRSFPQILNATHVEYLK